jgi:hypothetical protein
MMFHKWPGYPDEMGVWCPGEHCLVCRMVAILDELCELRPTSAAHLQALAQSEHEAKHGDI